MIAISNATATFLAPDGEVYSVEKGENVGTHYGVVVKIEKDAVIIDELVSTGRDGNCGGEGSWVKRSVKLKVRA